MLAVRFNCAYSNTLSTHPTPHPPPRHFCTGSGWEVLHDQRPRPDHPSVEPPPRRPRGAGQRAVREGLQGEPRPRDQRSVHLARQQPLRLVRRGQAGLPLGRGDRAGEYAGAQRTRSPRTTHARFRTNKRQPPVSPDTIHRPDIPARPPARAPAPARPTRAACRSSGSTTATSSA